MFIRIKIQTLHEWTKNQKIDIQTTCTPQIAFPKSSLHSQPLPKIHQRQHPNDRLLHDLLGLGAFSLGLRPSLAEKASICPKHLEGHWMGKNADEFRCGLGSLDTQKWKWVFSMFFPHHTNSIYFLKEVDGKPRIKRAQWASTTDCFACSDGELYVSLNLWSGNPVQVSSPLRWPGFWNAAMHPPTFKKLGSSWRGQECIWHRSGRFCGHRKVGVAAFLVSVMFWDNVRQETLFVFFAEARSATSDAKPPWAKGDLQTCSPSATSMKNFWLLRRGYVHICTQNIVAY